MANKILVTGATGTIGKAIVKELTAQNASFVAGVRDIAKASSALGGAALVAFDFSRPETFEKATEGVDRVFLLGPPMVYNLDELVTPFINFLKARKILRVVYLGALKLENVKELPFHTNVINKLDADGFDYTVLKPSFFAQNFKNYDWDNITQRGVLYAPAGTGKVAFIDTADIAGVAAKALTTDGHQRKSYELTGPEALSFSDAAAQLSEVTGKTIVYPQPTPKDYAETLKAAGAPDFIAPYMTSVYSLIADNHVNIVTDTVEKITGRKPTSLKNVLTKDFAA
jgi:uncharacterized protein YbjT (DUF2867 family)